MVSTENGTGTRRAEPDPDSLYSDRERAELLPDLTAIGEAERSRYRRDGFLAVRSAFEPARVHAALKGLAALLSHPGAARIEFEASATENLDDLDDLDGVERMDAVRKFMAFTDHEPVLHALAHDDQLLRVISMLLDDDSPVMFQDMALLKPPGGGREKPWHQDGAYFTLPPGSPVVGVWIALDAATTENGCMHVLRGSHRDGPVVHFLRRDWQICDDQVETVRDVAVPLPPGGALFFDGLVHHGTPTNRGPSRRRAVQFHYRPSSVTPITEDERLAVFGSEGKNVSC